MSRLSLLLLSLSLAACSRGTIDLNQDDDEDGGSDTGLASDGGAGADGGSASDGGSAGDGGSTGDGGSAGDGGSPGDGGGSGDGGGDGGGGASYGGSYFGRITVNASSDWGGYEVGGCEIEAQVMPDGMLDAWGPCDAYGYGAANAMITGMVEPSGAISGTVMLEISGYVPDFPLEGSTDGTVMTLHFEGEAGYGTDLIGDGELLRE